MKKFNFKSYLAGIITTVMVLSIALPAAATLGKRTLDVTYNDIKIALNGKKITPTDASGNVVEPFTVNGTTYLPVRAVGNALGLEVDWDSKAKTVLLTGIQAGDVWTDEDVIGIATYYELHLLGDGYGEVLDALEMMYDAIVLNNPDYNDYVSYCNLKFDEVHSATENAFEYCTTDAQYAVFRQFIEAEAKLVPVKTALTSYKNSKTSANFNAYATARSEASTAIDAAILAAHNNMVAIVSR